MIKMTHRIANKFKNIIHEFKVTHLYKIIRKFRKPPLPQNPDGIVLVHIGCGELNDSRYINVDSRSMPHVHYVGTVEDIDKYFGKHSIDLIYMCHILEHVSHQRLNVVLEKLCQCLKEGGILRISVPNFDTIVKIYTKTGDVKSIVNPLMGGQGYEGNAHYSIFNKAYLSALLKEAGFSEVGDWDAFNAEYHDFDDWSKRKYCYGDEEWDISLNIEAVK